MPLSKIHLLTLEDRSRCLCGVVGPLHAIYSVRLRDFPRESICAKCLQCHESIDPKKNDSAGESLP